MPKPRIFISSTFFDFEQSREDIEEFIKGMGYEPILSEKGDITYGKDQNMEEYCYKEIEMCDILIALIGGRYGSSSRHSESSITQTEIETAFKLNKQIYIFIKKDVNIEYETYILNKTNLEIKYKFVDNKNIFNFIEHIKSLKKNNPIFTFDTIKDINVCLKKQWAGLFYNFLNTPKNSIENEEHVIKILNKSREDNNIEKNKCSLITGEFLHIKSWNVNEENEKILKTDIDGDGVQETIIFGRYTQVGTKLHILMGKDLFVLNFDLKGLDENDECGNSCELAIKDVTNDGYPEILFAFYSEMLTAHLNIFRFDKKKYLNTPRGERSNPFIMIAHLKGQTEFRVLNGGRIEIPYGGQGLHEGYVWNGKKFIPDLETI